MDFLTAHWAQIVVLASVIGSAFTLRERLSTLVAAVSEHRAESKTRGDHLDAKIDSVVATLGEHKTRLDVRDTEHLHLVREVEKAHQRLDLQSEASTESQKELIHAVTQAVWAAATEATRGKK